MEFQMFLLVLALISIMIATHGQESPADAYWKMNLGDDVKMPKVVEDALLGTQSNTNDKASQASKVYNDIDVQAYAQQISRTGTNLAGEVYHNSAKAYAQRLSRTKSMVNSLTHYKDTYGNDAPQANMEQILGTKTTVTTKLYDRKGSKFLTDNSGLYFFEKDLVQPGTKMKLHFLVGPQEAKFIPKNLANTIPFSSTKLPQILNYFSVDPKSANAKIIEETIRLCESKPIKGESKSCETSLESMIAYVKSHLGNQVKALSTEIGKETKEEYTIDSAQKIKNEKNMVCHKMVYPYAVFACHTLSKTDAYQVSLIDTHGKNVKAVALCHKDTSDWTPEHVAFQLLKVQPGVPICHFLDGDAMIWIPK